jgi:hypothetical protein
MVDPTSELGEDVSEDDAPDCANCGDSIVEDPNHRVHTSVEDGTVVHQHFCSDACLDEWRGE